MLCRLCLGIMVGDWADLDGEPVHRTCLAEAELADICDPEDDVAEALIDPDEARRDVDDNVRVPRAGGRRRHHELD